METTERPRAAEITAPRARRGLLGNVRPSSRFYWVRVLSQNRVATSSALFILIVVLLAIGAPLVTSHDPQAVAPIDRLKPPSAERLFGTDDLGRDLFSRVIYGARVSLIVGIVVTLCAALAGSLLGLLSGYYERLDTPIMRLMDGLLAFPSILLAIAIMASLGRSLTNVVIALSIVYTPSIARLVRSTTLVTKRQPYVESARAIGHRDYAILGKYIFANSLSPLIVQCTFVVAYAIISEASLSFLGAGVNPEVPTWGNMLSDGQRLIQRAW
ncbi:MAG TPA: ABC transporter permease, partial [Thermomicrobiales bacterium]|nr:ABC transporter permease [Thermomicrobiales bacterium]